MRITSGSDRMKYIKFERGGYSYSVFEKADLFLLRNGRIQAMRVWLHETEKELSGTPIEQAAVAAISRGWTFSRTDAGPSIYREYKKTRAKVSKVDWDVNVDISKEKSKIIGIEIDLTGIKKS